MIDCAEDTVRQQHGLQGSVVWWLEVDAANKLFGQPASGIRFVQNLFVHFVPCLTCLKQETKPNGSLENMTQWFRKRNIHHPFQNSKPEIYPRHLY